MRARAPLKQRAAPVPVVVIDGRGFTWEEFGCMLLPYEGWQFRMEIIDRAEEA